MIEDTGIFLDPGVKDHGTHHVNRCLGKRRGTEHQAVRGSQMVVDRLHAAGRLLRRGGTADHGPELGIEIDPSLFGFPRAIDGAILTDSPNEPVAIPASGLDPGI